MNNIQVGITDHLDPEVEAMLMAMYSRSYAPIAGRIPSDEESIKEHKEKLGKFYIGYGHKSVGQLGNTTIWLEGVSMLAAKAIENNPLFNGQESSTRYIDFANQPMVSNNPLIIQWQEKFRAFYIKAVPQVIEKIKAEFPFELNKGKYHHKEDEEVQTAKMLTIWENTIKARAFDICRGILPAGCTTNVAFSGTFDTINDHFGEMLFHPCEEMRNIAESVLSGLKEKYPYACMDIEKNRERNSNVNDKFFYQELKEKYPGVYINEDLTLDRDDFEDLKDRKKFSKISRYYSNLYRFNLMGELDFGSYRDIHRHRNGVIAMEALSTTRGFHTFYLDSLPFELKKELMLLLFDYQTWHAWYIDKSKYCVYGLQYCTPMGYKVGVDYSCDLNQALYIFELRSGKTVHQTLRELVQFWVKDTNAQYPNILIHADMDEDNFTLRRGEQTFIEKV